MGAPPGSTPPPGEPLPLSQLLESTLTRLQSAGSGSPLGDGIIYCGNRHETVPRALFLDARLTPLERNAWQVCRLLLNEDGVTAFPTYAQLSPYLASMPLAQKASDETVARALTLLRLTRWLSLVRHRRDPITGRIQGNLYVLHDEPLTPYEALQLDPHYLGLVGHALTHAAKAVQRMGHHALQEITQDPLLSGRILPSRLQLLVQRLSSQPDSTEPSLVAGHRLATMSRVPVGSSVSSQSSESEVGSATARGSLRNPKTDRTVRTVRTNLNYNGIRTVQETPPNDQKLTLPEPFRKLRPEQQAGALAALARVEPNLQQPVLDEWATRCTSSTIRNPAGYLFGIIGKALRGDFHAWAAGQQLQDSADSPSRAQSSSVERASPSERSEAVEQHIANLRAILRAAPKTR